MQPFAYRRVDDERAAVAAAASQPGAVFVAGGTDFMQLWKAGISTPDLVIDISRLKLDVIAEREGGISIGALARMSDVADHKSIRDAYPAVTQALLASASPQVRNVATIGGNLLQRTRCAYFRSADLPCNKRSPGSGCGAIHGENRRNAIFGASEHCVATHASDLAVALVALDAKVQLLGRDGARVIPVEDLFRLPGEHPERDTVLSGGELIIAIELPRTSPVHGSRYLKVRDRASFEFAVVSAAVALHVEDGIIRAARVAAGGVGTKPWRLPACEAALAGARPGDLAYIEAAERAASGARPLGGNGFKIELLKRTVLRALQDAGGDA